MSLEQQMNAITRGALIIWYIMYVMNYKYHSIFFVNSILFIIILYYIQRNSMKENYTDKCDTLPIQNWVNIPKGNNLKIQTASQYRFCGKETDMYYDDRMYSQNQSLVGDANPKTKEKPVIVPPSHAWDFWSEDYVVPSHINDSTNQELFRSGYVGTSTCGNTLCEQKVENFTFPTPVSPQQHTYMNPTGTPGDLVSNEVYDAQQMLKHNLPSNLPVGVCERENVFNDLNKNLHTSMFGPNEYIQHEIIEPIQSNIGISFTQQFPPTTYQKDKNGVLYVSHDPRVVEAPQEQTPQQPVADASNIYDPRSFGYGTSYRSYVHNLTGQPRYFYDDIENIRRPNYIVRSNIDHAIWAQSYGPMDLNQMGNVPYEAGHQLAERQFLNDTIQQRTELQERAMRKVNAEAWQQRKAPLRRDQARRI
jgi:hypothetical protein